MEGGDPHAAVTAREDTRPQERSPCYDAVDEIALLGRRAAKVDARRLNGFMAHQVREQRDVVEPCKEVLGEAMPEGVRIDHLGVKAVVLCKRLQLIADAASGDALAETVAEKIAACASTLRKPLVRFGLKAFRNIEATQLAALTVKVEIARFYVFNLDLQQFRNARTSRTQIAHYEIPVEPLLGFQLPAEEAVIRVADDVLQKVLLLNLDELHLQIRLLHEVKVAIQGLQPQVDGLCLVVLHKPSLVG